MREKGVGEGVLDCVKIGSRQEVVVVPARLVWTLIIASLLLGWCGLLSMQCARAVAVASPSTLPVVLAMA